MAGDPSRVAQWDGADVYIADVGAAEPTDLTTPWGTDWGALGLLNGEDGFTWNREQETSEYYAWGGILVKQKKSKHKRTVTVVALEDNDNTFRLVNPGSIRSEADGLATARIVVPTSDEFALGFELTEGDRRLRRMITRATVEQIAEIKEAEEEPTVYSITIALYPEPDGTLYTELSGLITP